MKPNNFLKVLKYLGPTVLLFLIFKNTQNPRLLKKSKEPSHIGLNEPNRAKVLATWAICCARPRPFLILLTFIKSNSTNTDQHNDGTFHMEPIVRIMLQ